MTLSTSSGLNYDKNMHVAIPVDFYQSHGNSFGPWMENEIVVKQSVDRHQDNLKFVVIKSIHDNEIYLCADDFNTIKKKTALASVSPWDFTDEHSKLSVFSKWSSLIKENIKTFTSLEYFNRNMHIQWTEGDVLRISEYLNRCSKLTHNMCIKRGYRKFIRFEGSLIEFAWTVIWNLSIGYTVWAIVPEHLTLLTICLAQTGALAGLPPNTFNVIPVNWSLSTYRFENHVTFFNKRKGCTFVVFENSDMESAIDLIVDAASSHRGMLLWSLKNVLVQECIYEVFKQKLGNKKLNLSCTYKDFNLTKETSTQLKMMGNIMEKAKQEGVETIMLEDSMKNISALFLLENVSSSLSEEIQSHFGLPIVCVQTFRTCKEAINLLNANNFKKDNASSHSYNEKKAAVSIWCNNSAISFDVAFAAQSNLLWINNYEISPTLWHPDYERFRVLFPFCEGKTKSFESSNDDEDDCLTNELENYFELSSKQKKSWDSYSVEKKEEIFETAHKKLIEMQKNKSQMESNSDLTSSLIKHLSNAKTLLSSFKDDIKVENGIFTIKRYNPVGTIVMHLEKQQNDILEVLILAFVLGNSVIITTTDTFMVAIANLLKDSNFPILLCNFNKSRIKRDQTFHIRTKNISLDDDSIYFATQEEMINVFSDKKYIYCTYGG